VVGRNKAGNEGDVRAIRRGWTQEKRSGILFTGSRALDCEGVCAQRETQDLLVVSY
jgi:hypothetical protein